MSDTPAREVAPAAAPPETSPIGTAAPRRLLDRVVERWPAIDRAAYPVFASACVFYAAAVFYGYMHVQTRREWSAPLDDVFIHFDYARATARGYPFQWSEGNGFSSGNTSLTYPFVLALGYLGGFRSTDLMVWAAAVAWASTTFFLAAVGRFLDPLGRWAKYLVPPAVLSLGALDWSLFSGMENAFHLGVWALVLLPVLALVDAASDVRRVRRYGWLAGGAGALLYATRPESTVCVAVFALFAALAVRRTQGTREAVRTLLRVAVPGALAAVAQAVANRVFTGEWSANGAIVKLAINNPYMAPADKLRDYVDNLKHAVLRNTHHHIADFIPGKNLPWGWLVPLLGLVPLVSRKTRAFAVVLWAQIVGWLLLVSLNGQVRWQNERYTMSAVAWLLVLAAMGLAVLMAPAAAPSRIARRLWIGRIAFACLCAAVYWHHQAPNMRDQIWFFGRASRNIRDQHITAGKVLERLSPRRVLVGDAGALIYASDVPGLDLIGLGGYHDLPFARAGVHGLGASIELLERISPQDRPDMMAIYPSWWGNLPDIFGKRIVSVPVIGNVICGGAEKVLYKADWRALDRAGTPRSLRPGERVVDELDPGDLVDEKLHEYTFPRPGQGFVAFRVLPEPGQRTRELFDAGRVIAAGSAETARLRAPQGPGRLVLRTVAARPAAVEVRVDGKLLGRVGVRGEPTWVEPSIDLPADLPTRFTLSLTPVEGEWITFHAWVVERDAGSTLDGPSGG